MLRCDGQVAFTDKGNSDNGRDQWTNREDLSCAPRPAKQKPDSKQLPYHDLQDPAEEQRAVKGKETFENSLPGPEG
ncbi:UNVERIFIED_CONTAM: hypothetical protein FKN15_070415 [Acipenser sinensis]